MDDDEEGGESPLFCSNYVKFVSLLNRIMRKLLSVILFLFISLITFLSFGQNECIQRILKEASTIDTLSYSSGTGFFINNQGYIVTNKHVVGDYLEMTVKFKINGKEIQKKAELVGYLMDEDIAIIKIDVKGLVLPTIPYSFTKNELNIGNKIYTLGFPKPGVLGESIKLTEGIVNSTSGFQDNTSEYQISAQIQPGNSGSPMFDSKGNVKGVVYASYEAGQNVNYAIKSAKLIELLNSLKISYNAVESNVSFVQSVSKFQWSICLISVIQKKIYYSEFDINEEERPRINPNYRIDKSLCQDYQMEGFMNKFRNNETSSFSDINIIEASLFWTYVGNGTLPWKLRKYMNYFKLGAYENIIIEHDKERQNTTTRIYEDDPAGIDFYLDLGEFDYYFDSKIRLYGTGINFNLIELLRLDNYLSNIQDQIDDFTVNQFTTEEYFNSVKLQKAKLYVYRAFVYFVITSEFNSDEYSKISCDFVEKAKNINRDVEVWFPAENCN